MLAMTEQEHLEEKDIFFCMLLNVGVNYPAEI